MPSTLCFGYLIVLSKEGYDLILNKLSKFNLKKATPTKGFDPKGHIDFCRNKVNLDVYTHLLYPHDDIIINMEEREAELAIDDQNKKIMEEA